MSKQEFHHVRLASPSHSSFGSTQHLTQQIENGAPFDLATPRRWKPQNISDKLKQEGLLARLLERCHTSMHASVIWPLWCTAKSSPVLIASLISTNPAVRYVAIAKPETAPYGLVEAQQALQAAGLWKTLSPKIVYGENINLTRQYVSSGNADCGFVARSLVIHETEGIMPVDEKLYQPIEQWLGIVRASSRQSEAARFKEFLLGPAGRAILEKNGYSVPRS